MLLTITIIIANPNQFTLKSQPIIMLNHLLSYIIKKTMSKLIKFMILLKLKRCML